MVGMKALLVVAFGVGIAPSASAATLLAARTTLRPAPAPTTPATPVAPHTPVEGPRAFVLPPAPPPPDRTPSRLGVVGQKYKAPQTRMSQAGVTWSLNDRLSLQLSYERTAYAPTMSRDHDDGILTGLKVGF
ncbi:MAG TPA: hypothetical protein VKA21_15165 [Candidatus Binatia bacterium]|nr:hypothetical protein [Candidatus Binatia bacterium]